MSKKKVTLKIFILIVITDIGESIAQLFLKKGLAQTGIESVVISNIAEFFIRSISSPFIWLGLITFLLNFFLWITVLSRIDLSIAFPVGSTSYIFVPVLAMIFLHETLSPMRWAGILLIAAGIHFVSKSSHKEAR